MNVLPLACKAARLAAIVLGSSTVGLLLWSLASIAIFSIEPDNPCAGNDICFSRSEPGSTSRFVVYAPVRCSNPEMALGRAVGADYAKLRFEDADGDGSPEAIVESAAYRCRYGAAPCYDAWRFVLKVCPGCAIKVRQVNAAYLPQLTQMHARQWGDAHESAERPEDARH